MTACHKSRESRCCPAEPFCRYNWEFSLLKGLYWKLSQIILRFSRIKSQNRHNCSFIRQFGLIGLIKDWTKLHRSCIISNNNDGITSIKRWHSAQILRKQIGKIVRSIPKSHKIHRRFAGLEIARKSLGETSRDYV